MTDPRLFEAAAKWSKDPLAFVQKNYPWGEGELSRFDGPDEFQADVLACIRDNLSPNKPLKISVAGGVGPGKALAHGEPVLTPAGWRAIESIMLGDEVIAGDGSPTTVVGVWPQGERDLFRLRLDDGSSIVVDGDHQWLTWSLNERKRGKAPSIRTTIQIASSIIGRSDNGQLNHQIPTCDAVAHPRAVLAVEPYLLGLWLGDGSGHGRIGVSLPDKIAAVGGATRLLGLDGSRAAEKFIPRSYLHSSVSQRTALLQGLMDTDATVERKSAAITYDTMSPRLADDVSELVRSLGGVARRGTKRATLNGTDYGMAYRVYVSLPEDIAPFRTPSKVARYKPQWQHRNCKRTRRRYIASVEPAGRGLATCISVAHPSKLFIARDHIVTHNSALAAWVSDWALDTMTDTRVIVTANTGPQLYSKTWPEFLKWKRLSLFSSWFEPGSRIIRSVDPKRRDSWRCDAMTWDESSPESFAGLHNAGRRIILIMDESSAIPDTIWDVAEQALTDSNTEIVWLVLGNLTRNTGRFRQCFPGGAQAHLWHHFKIDTRKAKMTNKAQIQEWIDHYGIDSDFVRVRVLSEFPRAGDTQFISLETINAAATREASGTLYDPLIIGVDPARFGDDEFRISFRRGLDARSMPSIGFRGIDNMQGAARIAELNEIHRPDAIFIDDGGQGAGVLDRCRYLHLPVTGVTFGGKPDRSQVTQSGAVAYANKRAEIWGSMKDWLQHGAIENHPQLISELSAVEYGFKLVDGRDAIILERKEDMKKRGLSSPDWSDSLALTFAYPVAQSDHSHILGKHRQKHEFDYNPMSELYKLQR